jgi:catechol 2,3-dioxygenase-like lactoylglutathione lyase family enzyme
MERVPAKASEASLYPVQVCFVVDDVSQAAEDCAKRFGWGPFQAFTADVDASYRDWRGRKVTDVALGMAGRVQVELIHVREGHDAIATYQSRYGPGFQHLGISCRSREAAIARLEALGASVDEVNEFDGVKIAFVDVPTGPAMFELLEPTRADAAGGATRQHEHAASPAEGVFAIDRATLVTSDMDRSLSFYAKAFDWEPQEPVRETLRHPDGEQAFLRHLGRAGSLRLELLSPVGAGEDAYSRHLSRAEHGLVHASGRWIGDPPEGASADHEWLERGERFALLDWEGGAGGLQIRDEGSFSSERS